MIGKRFEEQILVKNLMREEDAGHIRDAEFRSLVNEAVKKVKPSLRPMLLETARPVCAAP